MTTTAPVEPMGERSVPSRQEAAGRGSQQTGSAARPEEDRMLDWLRPNKTLGGETRLRGYEIGEQIFTGAFSNIYLGRRLRDNFSVALKIMTKTGDRVARLLERKQGVMWEGELLQTLDHPNIVKCLEYGRTGKKEGYWLSLEYVETKLTAFIGRCNNEQEENELIDVLSQIAAAVAYLHEKGLIHRDLCLGNILLNPAGVVKLIDFGLTVPLDSTALRGRAGTPSYMAPEMIKKWLYTPGTDIYSFGVVMYELVTGVKPFRGAMPEQRMTRSLNVMPSPPSRMGQYCSPELERLVMKCISKDPQERAKSAREVQDALFLIRRKRDLS